LQLHTLAPETQADPFPAPDAKYFTASSPSLATVDGFLTAIWGFDPLRIWRVEAIQSTMAPGVSKVVVFVSERRPGAQVRSVVFFTTPDGNHAIAENAVISFGPKPFAENRAKLEQRADGPARGAASKELLLVEFADLQCPHCKEAQTTMDQIAKDFPKARIVVQSYPLVTKHPFAFQAAEYGYCVAQKSNDAYFAYADAVFATQASLTADDGVKTLNAAVTKAGLDPAAVAACAATDATKAKVTASLKLGEELGVSETPMLAINGHLVPLTNTSYGTLRSVIVFQAQQDGITNVAPPLAGFDPIR
jgi:protein-disulfide isomerase